MDASPPARFNARCGDLIETPGRPARQRVARGGSSARRAAACATTSNANVRIRRARASRRRDRPGGEPSAARVARAAATRALVAAASRGRCPAREQPSCSTISIRHRHRSWPPVSAPPRAGRDHGASRVRASRRRASARWASRRTRRSTVRREKAEQLPPALQADNRRCSERAARIDSAPNAARSSFSLRW